MTVRQVFYQATVRGVVEKSEAGYTKVQTDLVIMRRAGVAALRLARRQHPLAAQAAHLRQRAGGARRHRSVLSQGAVGDADSYVEIWLEKDALAGVVYPVTGAYDVPLMVARGYASVEFLHSAAEYINELDVPAYIYHLGDFDPSGVNAGEKIEETLRELAPERRDQFRTHRRHARADRGVGSADPPDQDIRQPRAKGFGDISVELDAIEPGTLRGLVRSGDRAASARRAIRGAQGRRGFRAPVDPRPGRHAAGQRKPPRRLIERRRRNDDARLLHRHHIDHARSGRQDLFARREEETQEDRGRGDRSRQRDNDRGDAGKHGRGAEADNGVENQVIALDSFIGATPGAPAEIGIVIEDELERLIGGRIPSAPDDRLLHGEGQACRRPPQAADAKLGLDPDRRRHARGHAGAMGAALAGRAAQASGSNSARDLDLPQDRIPRLVGAGGQRLGRREPGADARADPDQRSGHARRLAPACSRPVGSA